MIRAVLVALLAFAFAAPSQAAEPLVSEPGKYSGYSAEAYDGFTVSSIYVPARDGTRLALDIFQPTKAGVTETKKLPVLLSITQYRRAQRQADGTVTRNTGQSLHFLKSGYVVVIADARGKGASFGTRRGPWSNTEACDAHDLIGWLAKQSWSTGKVGMFGGSYLAGIQFAAAREQPPALKAIFPEIVPFSSFDSFMGMVPDQGPYYDSFDEAGDQKTAPVDEDKDGAMLKAAIEEHRKLLNVGAMPNRDSVSTATGTKYYEEVDPIYHLDKYAKAKLPIYTVGRWNNWLITGSTTGYANFQAPRKLLLTGGGGGRGGGTPIPSINSQTEQLRWFDYWLKGIDNGVMKQAPISYTVANTGEARTSKTWPPAAKTETLNLAEGKLSASPASGSVALKVEYELTPAQRADKGLKFESEAFTKARVISGYVQADFTASTTASDGDFLAYLQDIAPDGRVRDITEGRLRASQRAEQKAPFNNLGLPFHRANAADLKPMIPGKAERLRFAFLPIVWKVEPGHKLRLIVTGAIPQQSAGLDLFNATPRQNPAPTQTLVLGASKILLPFETQ